MIRRDEFLAMLLQRPAWQADAACHEHPEVNFFPPPGQSGDDARAVCARCLVRDECLAFAIETRTECGFFGGTSGNERKKLWRRTTRRGLYETRSRSAREEPAA